jgi:hypothetical protein
MGLFKKKLGDSPVPGTGTVSLPAGKVIIRYEEDRKGRSAEDSWPGIPDGFELTIQPATGGAAIPVKRGMGSSDYSTVKAIGSKYGSVEIPAAGDYTVTVAPFTASRELFEPRVTLKG